MNRQKENRTQSVLLAYSLTEFGTFLVATTHIAGSFGIVAWGTIESLASISPLRYALRYALYKES